MSFRLCITNAKGLTLGPARHESIHDAIASATRRIAQQHGTGWRVRVLDEATEQVRAWYEVDASPDAPAPQGSRMRDLRLSIVGGSKTVCPHRCSGICCVERRAGSG